MNLPISTAFIVSHRFEYDVSTLSLNSRKSLIFFFISSLTKLSLSKELKFRKSVKKVFLNHWEAYHIFWCTASCKIQGIILSYTINSNLQTGIMDSPVTPSIVSGSPVYMLISLPLSISHLTFIFLFLWET